MWLDCKITNFLSTPCGPELTRKFTKSQTRTPSRLGASRLLITILITCLNLCPNLCSCFPQRRLLLLPRPRRPSANFDLCFVAHLRTRHGRGQVEAHSSDLDEVAWTSPGPRASTKSHRPYCSWKKGRNNSCALHVPYAHYQSSASRGTDTTGGPSVQYSYCSG